MKVGHGDIPVKTPPSMTGGLNRPNPENFRSTSPRTVSGKDDTQTQAQPQDAERYGDLGRTGTTEGLAWGHRLHRSTHIRMVPPRGIRGTSDKKIEPTHGTGPNADRMALSGPCQHLLLE